MKKSTLYIVLLLIIFLSGYSGAQELPQVSTPRLELRNNTLVIHYDINNFKSGDEFHVWIEITDADGNIIGTRTLSGDVGKNIPGGENKEIIWDFKKDQVTTYANIYVQVNVEKQIPQQMAEEKKPPERTEAGETVATKRVGTSALILRSAVFPGFGFVKMEKSDLHLIKGVAGYGCIASAIILNRLAVSNYNKYLGSYEIAKSDNYFKKSVLQDKLSEVCAYTAVGIWAAEIVWILVESKGDKNSHTACGRKFSIDPEYDPLHHTSMISLSYKF